MDKYIASIIIPVYNAGSYLRETLDSVLKQTITDIEILLVDDGSTDNSVQIIKRYMEMDSRIKLLCQTEPSTDAARARNMGIVEARGKYLSVLDADDIFEPNLLEETLRIAEKENADVVIYDGYVYDGEEKTDLFSDWIVNWGRLKGKKVFSPDEVSSDLLQLKTSSAWNMLCRRDYIIRNKILFRPVPLGDDIEYQCLALIYARRIATCRKRLIHYRKNACENQSSHIDTLLDCACRPYSYLGEELSRRGLLEKFRHTFIESFLQNSMYNLRCAKSLADAEKLYRTVREMLGRYLNKCQKHPSEKVDRWIESVLSAKTYSEMLFMESRLKNNAVYDNLGLRLPFEKRKPVSLVIYGAGMYGKIMYGKISDEPDVEIVGWCDQNFKRLGSDVESPEIIGSREYDFIMVSVVDKCVYEAIKRDLINIGVDADKITWIKNEYN